MLVALTALAAQETEGDGSFPASPGKQKTHSPVQKGYSRNKEMWLVEPPLYCVQDPGFYSQ